MNYKNKLLPIIVYSSLCFFISVVAGISNGISFSSIMLRGFMFSIVGAGVFIIILFAFSRMFAGVNFSVAIPSFSMKTPDDLNNSDNNKSKQDTGASSPNIAKNPLASSIGNNIDIVIGDEKDSKTPVPPKIETLTDSQFSPTPLGGSANPMMTMNANTQGSQSQNNISALEKLVSQNIGGTDANAKKPGGTYTKTGLNARKRERMLQEERELSEVQTNLQIEVDKTMAEFDKSPEKVKLAVASLIKKGDNSN